jgi:hypothetical protein
MSGGARRNAPRRPESQESRKSLVKIIKPSKSRKLPDPFIEPIHGKRGPCALCTNYSDLTENHVPPEGIGNSGRWIAGSYMTTVTANPDMYFGRHFRGGVRFRTLCSDCNNGLGGKEDKALIELYDRVRKLVESPIQFPGVVQIAARPNLIVRGLLAHIVSANDSGVPNRFDVEARELFFKKTSLRFSSWNLYYWVYLGETIFLMRSAYLTSWNPSVELSEMHILKIYPLAFVFARRPTFHGLPNMMRFVQSRDDEETDVPILLHRREKHPVWPAVVTPKEVIFLGGNSSGVVARQD